MNEKKKYSDEEAINLITSSKNILELQNNMNLLYGNGKVITWEERLQQKAQREGTIEVMFFKKE